MAEGESGWFGGNAFLLFLPPIDVGGQRDVGSNRRSINDGVRPFHMLENFYSALISANGRYIGAI
jgi:hypothetical protein